MRRCETCGAQYEKTFEVLVAGQSHVFHNFVCAIQALAPTCEACGTRVIGRLVERESHLYCSADCAADAFERRPRA